MINKQTNEIVAAWCSCMAGTSRCCNHVIAALYKIDHAKTHGYFDPLCTSVPCGWNKANKRHVTGGRISDIYIRKKERSSQDKKQDANREEIRSQALAEFDPRNASHRKKQMKRFQIYSHHCINVDHPQLSSRASKSLTATLA